MLQKFLWFVMHLFLTFVIGVYDGFTVIEYHCNLGHAVHVPPNNELGREGGAWS